MGNVLVIGGGAAGMMAALAAARSGHRVRLYEKNEKLGKKLYITGKGRCNLTNACDTEDLFGNVVHNPKFLYSAFYSFTNLDMMDLMEKSGCPVKTERGGRVFPVSDRASDVTGALAGCLKKAGVDIFLKEEVLDLDIRDGRAAGIRLKKGGRPVEADAVIVATGGLSYPSTGSTGDGYRFARTLGHPVTECIPSLVPLEVKEWYAKELQGLSLRNVNVCVLDGKKKLYEEFGEMLFTHFGVSGPVILSASSIIGKSLRKKELTLKIDLKPALSAEQMDQRILREFEKNRNKQFKNAAESLFPAKLRPVMLELSQIPPEKKVHEISRAERRHFAGLIKDFRMTLTGLRGFSEAIITKGGVSVKAVDPKTMESRRVKGLYFAGEILDLDALTGGFNLQIAWSTGYMAGSSIEKTDPQKRDKKTV